MTITSKFDGRCHRCGESYVMGTQIDWRKSASGKGIVTCLDCIANGMGSSTYQRFIPPRQRAVPPPPYTSSPSPRSSAFSQPRGSMGGNVWDDLSNVPLPPPAVKPAPPPVKPTLTTLTLTALSALEACIIEAASRNITPEQESGWKKYQGLKALALRPGTDAEGQVALKQALLQAVKLAF